MICTLESNETASPETNIYVVDGRHGNARFMEYLGLEDFDHALAV